MRRSIVVLVTLATFFISASAASAAQGTIKLTPQQETSDVDSRGRGAFSWTIDGNQLCYTLTVDSLTLAPSAAHIHSGERNVAGGVVVGLLTPPSATSSVSDCITAVEGGGLTPTELGAIASNPRAHYVNVHTNNYPGGEVRGQLK